MRWKRIAKEVLIWIPTLLLALMFVVVGIRKFPENGGWSRMFRDFGYPVWFRIFIGVIETASALLLLVPRTAVYGAATIVVTMIGAMATVLVQSHGQLKSIIVPGACLVVAAIVMVARWKSQSRKVSESQRL